MNREAPIGIFDSGIGGLTVANAIQKKLPKENIIYFGDTKHLPYGEKSPDAIIRFSKKITSFLLNNKCKIIIIACNTASSVAYEFVKKSTEDSVPLNLTCTAEQVAETICYFIESGSTITGETLLLDGGMHLGNY